jgi:hypothetical protein
MTLVVFEVWLDPYCSFLSKFCNSYLCLGWKLEDLTKASGGGIVSPNLKVGSGYSSPNEECTC